MKRIMRNKGKLMIMISILMGVSIFLLGCTGGSSIEVWSNEKNTKNSMSMTYKKFKGYKFTEVDLKNGEEVTLNIDVRTNSGELSTLLMDKDKIYLRGPE